MLVSRWTLSFQTCLRGTQEWKHSKGLAKAYTLGLLKLGCKARPDSTESSAL
jgi:hypothetical protein